MGSSLISAYVNKGEKFPHSQCHLKLRDMHSFEIALVQGELHLRCFARCVEPLPLLEGLAVLHLRCFARCVEPLPLLEGLAVFRCFELC